MQKGTLWFGRPLILAMLAVALNGCVAVIPMAINHFSTPTEHIATAEVSASADKMFSAVVREAEGAGAGMKIANRDDSERRVEISDGVQTATIKVIEEGKSETQIIVAVSGGGREKQEKLSLQIILHLCQESGIECSVRGK